MDGCHSSTIADWFGRLVQVSSSVTRTVQGVAVGRDHGGTPEATAHGHGWPKTQLPDGIHIEMDQDLSSQGQPDESCHLYYIHELFVRRIIQDLPLLGR
jgi:hypothetical protein